MSDRDLIEALDKAPADVAAMLSLAAFDGLRAKEIAGLQREDILDHLKPPMLVGSAPKGHHQRMVPLNPLAWAALQAHGLPRSGPVFRLRRPAHVLVERRGNGATASWPTSAPPGRSTPSGTASRPSCMPSVSTCG
jgi:integrase